MSKKKWCMFQSGSVVKLLYTDPDEAGALAFLEEEGMGYKIEGCSDILTDKGVRTVVANRVTEKMSCFLSPYVTKGHLSLVVREDSLADNYCVFSSDDL